MAVTRDMIGGLRVNDDAVRLALGTLGCAGFGARSWMWRVVGQRVFNLTFHNWYRVRGWILRRFGARVQPTARLRPSVRIVAPWNLTIGAHTAVGDRAMLVCHAPVRIGDRCTVSQYTRVCAAMHDEDEPAGPVRIAPVVIEDDAWVAADVLVYPGVVIGSDAVVGSRSTVRTSLPGGMICAGEPARPLARRTTMTPQAPPSETGIRGGAAPEEWTTQKIASEKRGPHETAPGGPHIRGKDSRGMNT